MSSTEGSVSPRRTRSRARADEDADAGLNSERSRGQDTNSGKNATKIESDGLGASTRKRLYSGVSDLRDEHGGSGSECEQSVKRFRKPESQSAPLLSPAVDTRRTRNTTTHQEKNDRGYDDDAAVDVVNSNDDPLAELDVGTPVARSGVVVPRGYDERRKEELGGRVFHHYVVNQHETAMPTLRRAVPVYRSDGPRFGYDGRPSGSNTSEMPRLERRPIPATAPLLTTERTHVRVSKRKADDSGKQFKERRQQERELLPRDGRGRNLRPSRYYYDEEKSMIDDVDDVMYAAIDIGENDFIETTFDGDELVYASADELAASDAGDGTGGGGGRDTGMDTQMRSHPGMNQEGRTLPKQEGLMAHANVNNESIDSNDDEAPPELEPETPTMQKPPNQLPGPTKDNDTEFVEGLGQVIRVHTPNGTEQYIQLEPGQSIDEDSTLYMSESDNVEAGTRQDLREIEFHFLDSKNICCGFCGEIVPYDLLLSSHMPEHHPEVLEEGVTAFDDVSYEQWLKVKLSEEKRRLEESTLRSIYDDTSLGHGSGSRLYRNVSTIRVNPNEMSLNQLITALRKKMYEKLGRAVPVTLVDKQHARCGICNAVVSLNRKFEVIHLVRHFNAWHPSAHRCAGKWRLRKPQPGMGKPLSVQDFAVIDTSLDRAANLQCIWCGMFMSTEALAMHFSEVHPEQIEVPKCNLCLQELVINARLMEKYSDEFDISLPDEHRIKCGKYGTIHSSEARLHAAIEKRQKLCEEGQSANDVMDEDAEDDERATTVFNSRMTFGRRSKPKRQFIMPSFRQAAPVNSRYVEAVNECHWKCKICKGDILAAVISAGAIRHFRTEHPHQLHNMQYELCKTRLERISDGCMEFVNPQLIECLVCNMTYMLHRPFNMCRAIRHLRSKHPDLMPEFASSLDSTVNESQRKMLVHGQEQPEGLITDPATIAMLKAQYGVEFQRVQALKGANGEPVYVLLDEGEDIDAETASELAASVAAGDFEQADPEMQRGASSTTSEENVEQQQQPQKKVKHSPTKNDKSSVVSNKQSDETGAGHFVIASD